MPSEMSAELIESFEQTLVKPAILVSIVGKSGVEVYLTSWTEEITFDLKVYFPSDLIRMSAVATSIGAGVDNADAGGQMSESGVSVDDIDNGFFDGATFTVQIVDVDHLEYGSRILVTGTVGEIQVIDERFDAQLRSLMTRLKLAKGLVSSKTCDCARLGDKRCKLNLEGNVTKITGYSGGTPTTTSVPIRSGELTISSVQSDKKFTINGHGRPDYIYNFGFVKFLTGNNSGREFPIKEHRLNSGNAVITIRLNPVYEIESGDIVTLEVGCNRKLKYDSTDEPLSGCTCKEFGNVANFQGQWFLPGNDQVLRRA